MGGGGTGGDLDLRILRATTTRIITTITTMAAISSHRNRPEIGVFPPPPVVDDTTMVAEEYTCRPLYETVTVSVKEPVVFPAVNSVVVVSVAERDPRVLLSAQS
jgi:hypothetical protein